MFKKKISVSSGVSQLDRLLGGLFIGDNVVWYDDAGSLASLFSLNFIQESQANNKSLIYVSFDRSPKMIVEDLGPLAENQHLTILDCFTHGKGDGSEVFSKFYEKNGAQWPYQIIKVNEPWKPEKVSESIYSLHGTMKGDIRFIFETLTGMQDLWGGEDAILRFYSRSCPRLYELETIAYWIMEKGAHSDQLKAHINQVAQVAIDLSAEQGKPTLKILKADKRKPDMLNTPVHFWNDDMNITFQLTNRGDNGADLGQRMKVLRTRTGLSQKELADRIGVTPSTISQIESGSIYPSLPLLYRIAQTLDIDMASFFQQEVDIARRFLFMDTRTEIFFPELPKGSIKGYRLSPADAETDAEPYLIIIPPGKKLKSHFFNHKGEEMGYLLTGDLVVTLRGSAQAIRPGDIVYLISDTPSLWHNPGPEEARLLWIKIKK